jgi:sugar phosphate isomerase/epimerase
MKVGVSTLTLLHRPIAEATKSLVDLGFRIIELFCDSPAFHPDRLKDEEIDILLGWKETYGLTYFLHAPIVGLNPADNDRRIAAETLRLYRRSIEVSERLSCSGVVLHPGHLARPDAPREEGIQNSIRLIRSVLETGEGTGGLLLIENIGMKDSTLFRRARDFSDFIHFFPSEQVKGLIDVGHAALQGFDLIETARSLEERLVHLHLHDNSGTEDGHLPLGRGVIKIKEFIDTLKRQQWEGTGIIEIYGGEDYQRGLKESMQFLNFGSTARWRA